MTTPTTTTAMTVTVYGQPGCMPCKATARRLDRAGVDYTYLDVTTDPAASRAVRDHGYSSTPVVEVVRHTPTPDGLERDVTVWQGYRQDSLDALAATPAEG